MISVLTEGRPGMTAYVAWMQRSVFFI